MSLAPVIAVVGPSGVGKDSVIQGLLEREPGFQRVKRVITRPDGEDGEEFRRVSAAAFFELVKNDAFALHWTAHGLQYGIPREISDQRRSAEMVLVNLSRAVLERAKATFGNLIVISLTADARELERRLSARGRESSIEQIRRLGRVGTPISKGLDQLIEVDNSGPLTSTVDEILRRLQAPRG
ncbi:MAG: phosphonate metabolism protein/1,5-bisphosphokinase (PRPP-forming) PhnN [Ruegeria sp.]